MTSSQCNETALSAPLNVFLTVPCSRGGFWFAEEVPYLAFLSLRRVTVFWDHASGLLTLQLGLGNWSA